jgi:hypothetical protein
MYGLSVLVLHDWLRDHATFCAGDSYTGSVSKDKLCTRGDLGALIAWAPESMLDHLVRVALQGGEASLIHQGPPPGCGQSFMEAHLYQEVLFGTCVKALHLSQRETGKSLVFQKHASDFCRRNGVPMRFVG